MKLFLKYFTVVCFLTVSGANSAYAQRGKPVKAVDTTIIPQENVPAEVAKSFKKRFATATDVVWRLSGDEYRAEAVVRNVPTEASFKKDGTWLSTTEEFDPSKLPASVLKSVGAFFPKYTLASYKRKTESNKDITFIVGVYEPENLKKRLETKILLDKVGAVIRTIPPEESAVTESPETEQTVDKKTAKREAKMNKEFNKSRRTDIYPTKISESELPPSLLQWVSVRYPDYVYREILYTEDPDFEDEGNLYRIKIQRSGVGQAAAATVWFTRDGDFLKLDDSFRTEEELQKAEQAAVASEQTAAKERTTAKKSTRNEDVEPETPAPIIEERDEIPEEYTAALKLRLPRVKDVTWGEDEAGNWIAYFTDQNGKNEVMFTKTDSVHWVHTKTPVKDFNRIPFAARSYIENNYPKQVSIKQAWSVRAAGVKPYFIVEIYNKKDKSSEILEFWQTGKVKE